MIKKQYQRIYSLNLSQGRHIFVGLKAFEMGALSDSIAQFIYKNELFSDLLVTLKNEQLTKVDLDNLFSFFAHFFLKLNNTN
jgi:hypothetical protein